MCCSGADVILHFLADLAIASLCVLLGGTLIYQWLGKRYWRGIAQDFEQQLNQRLAPKREDEPTVPERRVG